jgi:hypothetical protein
MPFWGGSPEQYQQFPMFGPGQQGLYDQLMRASQGAGAGGAFGDSADYYRGLLGDDSQDFQAFAAPEMRQFQQETIPGLSEQFAGMGSGALSSSGFRNSAVNAGAGLAERLGSLRASLRQNAAQGLQGIGQMGMGNYYNNVLRPAQPGFGGAQLGGLIGSLGGSFFGPMGTAAGGSIGQGIGNAFSNWWNGNSNKAGPAQPGQQQGM